MSLLTFIVHSHENSPSLLYPLWDGRLENNDGGNSIETDLCWWRDALVKLFTLHHDPFIVPYTSSIHQPERFSISLRTPSLFLAPLGSIPSIIYTFGTNKTRRSALLTDILALSFSHNALSLLKLDSFKTGCVLLSGLFFYDIWWVFGTEVVSTTSSYPPIPFMVLINNVLPNHTPRWSKSRQH